MEANKTNVSSIYIQHLLNDPFNYDYNEYVSVLGHEKAKDIFAFFYGQNSTPLKSRSIWLINSKENQGTKKYLFGLFDSNRIETVCIKRRTGTTVCVTTQSGCAVQCKFCSSGKNGLIRNLTASEIVQQVLFVREKVNRIVFMGSGEPLENYSNVIKSIHILRERDGLDFPTDGITLSTVGPVKYLKKLREEHLKIQLILSLHATNQKIRNLLIPGMRSNDIEETVKAVISYSNRHHRKVVIGYLLFPGYNDSIEDCKRLIEWFRGENILINLMRLNSTDHCSIAGATEKQMLHFKLNLKEKGLDVVIRQPHGLNINAACGQLRANIYK